MNTANIGNMPMNLKLRSEPVSKPEVEVALADSGVPEALAVMRMVIGIPVTDKDFPVVEKVFL